MITKQDILLEKLLREASDAPRYKGATHTVTFSRDIFYYNKDEVERQRALAERSDDTRVTYEDHIKAVKTARFMLHQETQADIAMTILTHRWFKDYRAKAFKGTGSFKEDFAFVVTRVGNILDHKTSKIIPVDVMDKLKDITEPTLVQVNHLVSSIETVDVSTRVLTLQEWATKFNVGASESITYVVAGRKL